MNGSTRRGFRHLVFESPMTMEGLEARQLLAAPIVDSIALSLGDGRFIESIDAMNTVTVNAFDPDGTAISRVEFELGGEVVVDDDPSGGFSGQLNMRSVGSAGATLLVRAFDASGEVGTSSRQLRGIDRPAWATESEAFWVGDIEFDPDQRVYEATVGVAYGSPAVPLPIDFLGFKVLRHIPTGEPITEGTSSVGASIAHTFRIPLSGDAPVFQSGAFTLNVQLWGKDAFSEIIPFDSPSGTFDSPEFTYGSFSIEAEVAINQSLNLNHTVTWSFNLTPEVPGFDGTFAALPLIRQFNVDMEFGLGFNIDASLGASLRATFVDGAFSDFQTSFDASFKFSPYVSFGLNILSDTFKFGLQVGGGFEVGFVKEFDGSFRVPFENTLFVNFTSSVNFFGLESDILRPLTETPLFRTDDLITDSTGSPISVPELTLPEVPLPDITSVNFIDAAGGIASGYLRTDSPEQVAQVVVNMRNASGSYSGATQLTTGGGPRTDLAISGGQRPFALWTQGQLNAPDPQAGFVGQDIYFSRYNNGVWSAPAVLSDDSPTLADFQPTVAVDESGNAMAAWVQSEDGRLDNRLRETTIKIARWNGTRWIEYNGIDLPFVVFEGNVGAADLRPKLTALDGGGFVLTYVTENPDDTSYLNWVRYDSSGMFGTGELGRGSTRNTGLFGASQQINSVSPVGLDGGGYAIGYTRTLVSGEVRAEVFLYRPGSLGQSDEFPAHEVIAQTSRVAFDVSLASNGDTVAALFVGAGLGRQIFASFRNVSEPAGSWSEPNQITDGQRPYSHVSGAFDESTGNLLVSYSASDPYGVSSMTAPLTRFDAERLDPLEPIVTVIPNAADLAIGEDALVLPVYLDDSGQATYAYLFTVRNHGMRASEPFTINFEGPDGTIVDQMQHPGLGVGDGETFEGSANAVISNIRLNAPGDANAGDNSLFFPAVRSFGGRGADGFVEYLRTNGFAVNVADDPDTARVEAFTFHYFRGGDSIVDRLTSDPTISASYSRTDWNAENYWFQDSQGSIYSLWHGGDVHLAFFVNDDGGLPNVPVGSHQWHLTNLSDAAGLIGSTNFEPGSISGVFTGWRAFSIHGISNGSLMSLWWAPATSAGTFIDTDGQRKPGSAAGLRANGWQLNSISNFLVDPVAGVPTTSPVFAPFTETQANGRTQFDAVQAMPRIFNNGMSIVLVDISGTVWVASFSVWQSSFDPLYTNPPRSDLNRMWLIEPLGLVPAHESFAWLPDQINSAVESYRSRAGVD